MKRSCKILAVALLLVLLTGGGVILGMRYQSSKEIKETSGTAAAEDQPEIDDSATEWTGQKETYTGKQTRDTIDIPGFDAMSFRAGTTDQTVNLYNPEQNTCYFRMSIYLPDGTKLWESKLIEPGKAVYDLNLDQPLNEGEYKDSILKYECFNMDADKTPLNGSEIHFTLRVLT